MCKSSVAFVSRDTTVPTEQYKRSPLLTVFGAQAATLACPEAVGATHRSSSCLPTLFYGLLSLFFTNQVRLDQFLFIRHFKLSGKISKLISMSSCLPFSEMFEKCPARDAIKECCVVIRAPQGARPVSTSYSSFLHYI